MSARPVVIAAGGTGGHLFPAEALATELKRRGRELVLVTDRRGGDYESRFPGVSIHAVRAGKYAGQGLLDKAKAAFETSLGAIAARRLLKEIAPAAAVGFGGYASLPTMLAATAQGVPSLIHEQNARLGRANRLLAAKVDAIATAFAETSGLREAYKAKAHVTGNPVRAAIVAVRVLEYTPPAEGGSFRLLVLGGSQGARVLSDVVPAALASLDDAIRQRLRVVQQARPEDLARVRAAYASCDILAELAPFFADVPAQLAVCHLVISRAGASTIAELAVTGRPAILVPFAAAADDHQTENARVLTDAGGAFTLAEDRLTVPALAESVKALLKDPFSLAAMAQKAKAQGQPNATFALADLVEELGRNGNRDLGRAAA